MRGPTSNATCSALVTPIQAPWDLDPNQIYLASWQAYSLDPTASYDMVRNSQLVTWNNGQTDQQTSLPLLPVSHSLYTKIHDFSPDHDKKMETGRWVPCNVGDRWGNESEAFWSAGHWAEAEGRTFLPSRCRDNLSKTMGANNHPGLFYTNQCRLLTSVVYSEGDQQIHKPLRNDGDYDRCVQWISQTEDDVTEMRGKGMSEDDIEVDVTWKLCSAGKSSLRRILDGNDRETCQRDDDAHSDNEGYCKTPMFTEDGCKAWRKKHHS